MQEAFAAAGSESQESGSLAQLVVAFIGIRYAEKPEQSAWKSAAAPREPLIKYRMLRASLVRLQLVHPCRNRHTGNTEQHQEQRDTFCLSKADAKNMIIRIDADLLYQ